MSWTSPTCTICKASGESDRHGHTPLGVSVCPFRSGGRGRGCSREATLLARLQSPSGGRSHAGLGMECAAFCSTAASDPSRSLGPLKWFPATLQIGSYFCLFASPYRPLAPKLPYIRCVATIMGYGQSPRSAPPLLTDDSDDGTLPVYIEEWPRLPSFGLPPQLRLF